MSRARTAVIALVAATLAGGAPHVRAQEGGREQRLMQQLDTLLPILTRAREERDRAAAARDSALSANPEERLDTFRIGLLRVVTFPDQSAAARDLIGEAWAEWGEAVAHSSALDRITFFFNWSARERPQWLDQPTVKEISAPVYMPRGFVVENARAAIWSVLQQLELGGTEVARWAGPVRPPLEPVEAYRELVTAPSKAARACANGDTPACILTLGLRLPEDRLEAWYTPEERMRLALDNLEERYGGWALYERWNPEGASLLKRCRAEGPHGDVSACDAWLRQAGVPAPLITGRSFMAWIAIEEGGKGAFDRLVAHSTTSPDEALEAASGLPLEVLADRWLAWVEDHRPVVYADLGTRRWAALFWFLFAGLLALRSTRWRLG